MSESQKVIIAWDLGATKCTAGLLTLEKDQQLVCHNTRTIKLKEAVSLADLVGQFDKAFDFPMANADAICIGAAGHFDGQRILHENPYPYPMTIQQIAEKQHWPAYAVIHDYASIVCSTFTNHVHESENVQRLNNCPINPYGRRVAFGIGTGLGLKDGILLPSGDFWLGHNEMGHIGIASPPQAVESDAVRHRFLVDYFTYAFPHQAVTFENVLSGEGLVRLYRFLHPEVHAISPEEVGHKLQTEQEPELLDLFAWYAGLFAGTVQLSFMPSGGLYITGGVALNNIKMFSHPAFERGIQASPAYLAQRKTYPLAVLCNAENALYGCGYYAAKRLLASVDEEGKVKKAAVTYL